MDVIWAIFKKIKSPQAKPMICLVVGVNLANIYIVIITQANEMCAYEGDLG